MIIGVGGALLFWYIALLSNSGFGNFIIMVLVFNILITLLNVYHFLSIFKGCKNCEFAFNWGICPGFQNILDRFEKHKLPNLFKGFEKYSDSIKEKRNKK